MGLAEKLPEPSKWIFKSFWIDFCVFVVPMFLATYGMLLLPYYSELLVADMTLYGVVHCALSMGHVFTTFIPTVYDKEIRQIVGRKIWLTPVLAIFLFGILYVAYYRGFIFVLAVYGFYHVFVQHLMWLKTLHRREGISKAAGRFETYFFLALNLIPIISWSSGRVIDEPSFFNHGDIALNQAFLDLSALAPILTVILFVYVAFLMFNHRSDLKAAPWGKIIFFTTTYVWLVVGLIYLKSTSFFIIYNVGTHAISYYVYIARGWNSPLAAGLMPKRKAIFVYVFGPVLGVCWVSFWNYGQSWMSQSMLYFQWIHVIFHFALDGVIWRGTNRRPT